MEMYGKMKDETSALFWVKDAYGLTPEAEVGLRERVVKVKLLQDILGNVV
jgi:hypothetical protein